MNQIPTARTCPFAPSGDLLHRPPVSRLGYPGGAEGWVVTGYAEARQLLADPRSSAQAERVRSPIRSGPPQPMPAGSFSFMDPPGHTRYRKLLTGQFTVRRMRSLEPRVEKIAAELADRMAAGPAPVDLVKAFALPLPSRVICELLGVPYTDHEFFQHHSANMADPRNHAEERDAAGAALFGYLGGLVERKRVEPGDDLISGLLDELTTEEITGIAVTLLFAGHETTANMLALGTFALLQNPEQLGKLRDDPDLVEDAVEELLRHLSIVQYEVNRAALADIEIGGETIKAGESFLISLPAVNRDPERFPRPAELDITRPTAGHLAFGHGIHQCLGQQLARIELRIGYSTLVRRFPALRLAIPAGEVPLNTHRGIYGVGALPVSW